MIKVMIAAGEDLSSLFGQFLNESGFLTKMDCDDVFNVVKWFYYPYKLIIKILLLYENKSLMKLGFS